MKELTALCSASPPPGPVFGSMNQFVGLGIFVDTYPNGDKIHDVSNSLVVLLTLHDAAAAQLVHASVDR